jgi:crossover junction endodeoxyribonuclease RuvC
MRVLGIDPGTAALGYGLIERAEGGLRAVDFGCLVTSPDTPMPERLRQIHALVARQIEHHHPDLVAVERVFFSRNAQTAFGVGQARGVVLLAAAQAGIDVREATPNEVKLGVTGYGGADKAQVGRMVSVILSLPEIPTPDDTADALAIAITAANAEQITAEADDGRSTVADRAAVAPIARGETPYQRAVRDALSREAKVSTDARPGPGRRAS